MNAIVLAGGPRDAVAKTDPDAPNKAFIKIGGTELVARTLQAVRASPRIEKIIVVAPPSARSRPSLNLADELRPDGKRIGDSLASGISGLDPDTPVLITPSDLPVLSADAVDEFVSLALSLDAELTYGCLERRIHQAAYPQIPHTWARLRDGTFCGAGMMTLRPRSYPLLAAVIERLASARKSPFALASLFGWDILLRFAVNRLSIKQAESRASKILGAPVRAVMSTHAEMAVNVDRVSDIALAEQLVRQLSC
ncbi:MAG: NTP transferase domain-containing protein [Candidatus Eremiobacteraeota bacterium]|nr:NTP transferase domain-containing protein [Candidatus Eremiobacteraeota bacterium]